MLVLALLPMAGNAQLRVASPASPVVNPDRTLTFNFRATAAEKVELSGQFLRGYQIMQKDSNGKVTYCWYYSERFATPRPLLVNTPPGYDKSNESYPVFYLVSGTTDTEETWFKVGKANIILDNLIDQKKAVPMINVLPCWNMLTGAPIPSSPQAAEVYKKFSDELTEKIIPFVEENFRTIPHRESRAIAGFSRGGGQSLFTGFTHFDKFAWIGSYSAYLTRQVFDHYFDHLVKNTRQTNDLMKLLWLGVGSEDFLYNEAQAFIDLMNELKIDNVSLVTGGGHTWMNSRHYLTETLQILFN